MLTFPKTEKLISAFAAKMNWIAAAAVFLIMLLTTADVVLRMFRHPIPGTFEIVGLVGSMIISFSLPYTTLQKGHIAVEFLVQKLPRRFHAGINIFNSGIGAILFGVISWQSALYAGSLKLSGEVSATLQMPTYPFVYGVALGSAMLCLVLIVDIIKQFRGVDIA